MNQLERVRVASMGNENAKYFSQLRGYYRGKNRNETNWNASMVIIINNYYEYILTW